MTDHLHTPGHDLEREAHRASCAECAATWAALEGIAAEARRLPLLTPSRDLWSGIEARIAGAALPSAGAAAAPAQVRRAWFARPGFRYAMAASLLVAATAGITWSIARSGLGAPDAAPLTARAAAPDPAGGPSPSPRAVAQLAAFDNTVAGVDREVATLQAIVDERRDQLDPRTVAVLEANLALIDRAIAESRAALEADPASRFLAAQVARAYQSKLTLLRGAARLPAGT